MIDKQVVSKMEDGKEKQMMEILASEGKPYIKKHDGYAVEMKEEKQITYTDYNNTEMTMTIPKGSYLMVGEDSSYPKIVTAKEFNDSNKFCGDHVETSEEEANEEHEASESSAKEKKEEEGKRKAPKIGLELMEGNY